jgi:hypothetical protein
MTCSLAGAPADPRQRRALLHAVLGTCRQQLSEARIKLRLRTVLADSGYVTNRTSPAPPPRACGHPWRPVPSLRVRGTAQAEPDRSLADAGAAREAVDEPPATLGESGAYQRSLAHVASLASPRSTPAQVYGD